MIGQILAVATMTIVNIALCTAAVGQDAATAQEVLTKVREAASTLSKTGNVAQFKGKQTPWVWKDTHIFVYDCDKMLIVADPVKLQPKKATAGLVYLDMGNVCRTAKKKKNEDSGFWTEGRWPKPGENKVSRQLTYYLRAKGTPYIVIAAVYDDKTTIAEVSKLSGTN